MLKEQERLDDLIKENLKIIQNDEVFSFSTDALLLAHFTKVRKNDSILDLCAGNGVIDVLKNAKNRKLQLLTLSVINAFFEDMMHAKVGIENNFIFTDLKPLIKEYTTRLTLNQMILMYDQITEAHKKLIQNVNPMLVFEQIVIKGVS